MAENTASLLCYAGGWITGLLFLLTDKRPAVRFHAMQSAVVFGALNFVCLIVFLTFESALILFPIGLLVLAIWVFLMFKAYQGQGFQIPVVGDVAKSLVVLFDKLLPPPPQEWPQESAAPPSGPAATVTPRTPDAPFDPARGRLTIQLIDQIGYWRVEDVTKAFGPPIKRMPDEAAMTEAFTYTYPGSVGRPYEITLIFDRSQLLAGVTIAPHDLSSAEVVIAVGEKPSATVTLPDGRQTRDFAPLQHALHVHPSGAVILILFYGQQAKAIFPKWETWTTHLP